MRNSCAVGIKILWSNGISLVRYLSTISSMTPSETFFFSNNTSYSLVYCWRLSMANWSSLIAKRTITLGCTRYFLICSTMIVAWLVWRSMSSIMIISLPLGLPIYFMKIVTNSPKLALRFTAADKLTNCSKSSYGFSASDARRQLKSFCKSANFPKRTVRSKLFLGSLTFWYSWYNDANTSAMIPWYSSKNEGSISESLWKEQLFTSW